MSRLDALRALYDGIKAGRDTIDLYPAFPEIEHRNLIALALLPNDLRAVGAALAFIAATLPGAIVDLIAQDDRRRWEVVLVNSAFKFLAHEGQQEQLATALILAGLAAHIAEEEGK
jgi:predicted RNA polymerase sigma factor